MRLTRMLLGSKRKRYKSVVGHQTLGKRRIPYIFSSGHREEFVKNLERETTNEMWLTRSFLNERQEKNLKQKIVKEYSADRTFLKQENEDYLAANDQYVRYMRNNQTMEEKWKHISDRVRLVV